MNTTLLRSLLVLLTLGIMSACANPESTGRKGSSVKVYGTVDTGVGYQSHSISRD